MDSGTKEWWMFAKWSDEYERGVDEYVQKAFASKSQGNQICCPCESCHYRFWRHEGVVRDHLICNGFVPRTDKLSELGMSIEREQIILNNDEGSNPNDFNDDIVGLSHDARDAFRKGPNDEAKKFIKLVEEGQEELYLGYISWKTKDNLSGRRDLVELNLMLELQPIELEDGSEEFQRSRFWMSLEQKRKFWQNSILENENDDSTSEYDGENEVENGNIMEANNLISGKRKASKQVSKQVNKSSLCPKTMADVVEVNSHKKHAVDVVQNIHSIKEKYMVPEAGREWVIQAINGSWKAHKCFTKKNYFYAYPTNALRWFHKLDTISEPQFKELLQYWHSKEGEEISKINKDNCLMLDDMHTMGRNSYAILRHELQQEDLDKHEPSQARVYKESRKRTVGTKYLTNHDKTEENISLQHEDGSKSKDPYSKVIPDPKRKSRVRLQGKGVKNLTTAILTQLRDADPRINVVIPDFAIPSAPTYASSAPHLLVDQNG
uniref:Transposase-associated domain-containing protein n=1 Tax=Chenopodium quinoa TaxID=63459 RepID=A0A803MTJ2_CHEQI